MAKPNINWLNDDSSVFVNIFQTEVTKNLLHEAVKPHQELQRHIWLSSSGTENFPKMIALSKDAILASAKGVNIHLKVNRGDSWLNILPLFHIGGLAIHARAYLSESEVWDFSEKKWDPEQFVKLLNEYKIAFSSLTPTHVHDIVSLNLKAPKFLKKIVVGGAAFPQLLHEKAFSLGWPLLKSFGMTELCSQIATSSSIHPESNLELLPHIELKFDHENFLEIKSEALLTGYVLGNDQSRVFINPKIDEWYKSQDKGEFNNGALQIYGRGASFIKIGGESINLTELEIIWENIKLKQKYEGDAVLIDLPDGRLGMIICLAVVARKNCALQNVIEEFHKQILPIAKIRHIYQVSNIPRTDLFKIKKNDLREILITYVHH